MSAILSTAYTIVEPDYMDINSFKLELPKAVTTRLKSALLPYLEAIGLSGFEKWKRRKAFIVGNTGKHTIFVLLCFDSIHRIIHTVVLLIYTYFNLIYRIWKNQSMCIFEVWKGYVRKRN